jgi:hypothetical protein
MASSFLDSLGLSGAFRYIALMPRRKLYPMPIEGLIDHPVARDLPAAAFGMLSRLCLHFWAAECRPLPKSEDELFAIARAHRPTWRRWKAQILKAFEDIRPELERYFQLRESKGTTLRLLSDRGYAARMRKRLQDSAERQRAAGVVLPTNKRKAANQAAIVEGRQGETGFLD